MGPGLIESGMGGAGAPPARVGATTPQGPGVERAPVGGAQDQGSNATPEEQEQYETLVLNAIEYIHGPGREGVLKRMQTGAPDEAVGTIAGQLGLSIVESARAAGVEIGDDIVFHAGNEIVAELAEMGEAAGFFDANEEFVERAFYAASVVYTRGAEQRGWITEEDKTALASQLGGLPKQGASAPAAPGIGA